MLKRFLMIVITVAGLLQWGGTARAADPHGAADGHHGPAIDQRLVPIPPSKDTIISAVWVLIIFIVMLAILYPTAWKNILAGLKKREERIRSDIADAEASRLKAEATLKQYNEQLAAAEGRVREMLSKATADGERLATQIRMKAQQEAEEIKERTARELESAKNAAIREVHEATVDLSTKIAEKILKRNLNADDQRDLVRSSLEQLSSVAKN